MLTWAYAKSYSDIQIDYLTLEPFPLKPEVYHELTYHSLIPEIEQSELLSLHQSDFGHKNDYGNFCFRKECITLQSFREDQLDQMKELKIIPSYFSTHTFYWGDWHRDSVFGKDRAMRISPTKSTLNRNMPFTVHNDAPVVPPDMIRLLWSTTNRKTRSGKVLGEEQKISTYSALEAMTINAAYQHFEDDIKGSIEVGKLADLVVLSEDPLSIDTKNLLEVNVVATFSRGVEVFNSAK